MTDQQLVRRLISVVVLKCVILGGIWWLFFSPHMREADEVMPIPQNQQTTTTGESTHEH